MRAIDSDRLLVTHRGRSRIRSPTPISTFHSWHMNWKPASEEDIRDLIDSACERMSAEQARVWERIKVPPEKWDLDPWGNEGNGFWIVALIGRWVVWFNDIEWGFNLSRYASYGTIGEYWCNQDGLDAVVDDVVSGLRGG